MSAETKANKTSEGDKAKVFADRMKGLFFLVASLSTIIVMLMFILVWQPIWVAGFKDFHTISESIDKLDETAQPASEAVPMMLGEMSKMTKNLDSIHLTMLEMHASIQTLESMPPRMSEMTAAVEHMDYTMTTEMEQVNKMMGQMNVSMREIIYLIDEMEDQMSPVGMMPFNW